MSKFSKSANTRNKIIISTTNDETNVQYAGDANLYLTILNNYYNATIDDYPPYHYFIDVDGSIYNIKGDYLKISLSDIYSPYNDDISVLIATSSLEDIVSIQEDALINMCSDICMRFNILAQDIEYLYDSNDNIYNKLDIIHQTVTNLNASKKSVFALIEYSAMNVLHANENIGVFRCQSDIYTYTDLAYAFNNDIALLKQINIHISGIDPVPGDHIIYIKNISLMHRDILISINKNVSLIYNKIEALINERFSQ